MIQDKEGHQQRLFIKHFADGCNFTACNNRNESIFNFMLVYSLGKTITTLTPDFLFRLKRPRRMLQWLKGSKLTLHVQEAINEEAHCLLVLL